MLNTLDMFEKDNKAHGKMLWTIIGTMIALFVLNMVYNYFLLTNISKQFADGEKITNSIVENINNSDIEEAVVAKITDEGIADAVVSKLADKQIDKLSSDVAEKLDKDVISKVDSNAIEDALVKKITDQGLADAVVTRLRDIEIEESGGQEIYEKIKFIEKANNELQFGNTDLDEIKKEFETAKAQMEAAAATPTADAPAGEDETPATGASDKVLTEKKYVKGNESAKLTVYEHSDFNCPYCVRLHESGVMEQLLENFGDDVNLLFRNRPVIGGENSRLKAKATYCAGELGGTDAYFSMIDKTFTTSPSDADALVALGVELGLDEAALTECVSSDKYDAEIEKTIEEGNNFGISGTPGTVIVNNETGEYQVVKGAAPYASFEQAVETLLAE